MRIIDYPEVLKIKDDDYLIMDDGTGKPTKILASYFKDVEPEPTPIEYLYNWDFTQSLTDEIAGVTVSLGGNATKNENGIFINDSTSYVSLNINDISSQNQTIIMEFDIGEMTDENGNNHGRFLMWQEDTGLIFNKNRTPKEWDIYGTNWTYSQPPIIDDSIFSNSTLKVVLNKDDVEIYVNNTYITKNTASYVYLVNFRYIGSSSASFHNVNIKALRIWTEEG